MTSKIIKEKRLEVYLLVAVNQLKEVILKKKLIGVLEIDVHKKPKDTIPKITFQMPIFSEEYLSQVDMRRPVKSINYKYLTDPTSGVMGLGANIGILDRSSLKLRILRRKLAFKKSFPLKIRLEFGDDFLFKKLKIPKDRFYHFLGYCNPMGIEDLYKQGKILEVIKILQEESKSYLKIIVNEN